MIILHKYKLIFLKTRKTAGTSIEHYLSQFAGPDDIVTAVSPPIEGHVPRNNRGFFNPLTDSRVQGIGVKQARTLVSVVRNQQRFFNHMTATDLRRRIPEETWNSYLKVTVERNPWDKVASMYNMLKHDRGLDVTIDEVIDKELPLNFPVYSDPETGVVVADHVMRYEDLSEELSKVLALVGIPFTGDLGVKAKSGSRTKRERVRITREQSRRIQKRFAKEIELMGYDPSIAKVEFEDTEGVEEV